VMGWICKILLFRRWKILFLTESDLEPSQTHPAPLYEQLYVLCAQPHLQLTRSSKLNHLAQLTQAGNFCGITPGQKRGGSLSSPSLSDRRDLRVFQ
jgi:hypothetical protein